MLAAIVLLAFVLAAPSPSSLWTAAGAVGVESHCVVEVVGQLADGEFVFADEVCFDSLGGALVFASGGELSESEVDHLSGPGLVAEPESGMTLSTFTLGIHFDGSNGTGSSISIVGSSCTGGYWNTGGTWANRISSSWNGCYRLRHYDNPNKSGAWVDTTGVGQTDNLPGPMNNRTESVAYYSS